ncbi:LYR motif-containing protein 2-like [Amphiura filiformis]|uniref:LYR motif-containing protein 2-like n=1 Tax=Amphiura filiformis TaxID=82378 RepID=UPI003B21DCAD
MAAPTSRFCTQAMSLKHFLLRQQVLALYRDIQRTLRKVPDAKDREELHRWARDEFKRNKHHTDEMAIKMMLTQGKQTLRKLEGTLQLAS